MMRLLLLFPPLRSPCSRFFYNYNKKYAVSSDLSVFCNRVTIFFDSGRGIKKKFRQPKYKSGERNFFQPRRSNHHKSFLFFILQNGTLAQWLDFSVVALIIFVEGRNLFRGDFHRVRHHVPLDIFCQRRCRQGS